MSAAPRSKPGPKPGTVVARAKVDWDALEPHYRAGVRTVAAIAAEFGCTDVAVVKHAKKFGWTRNLKAKIEAKAQAKLAAIMARETNPKAKFNEALRVEVEAEVSARVQLAHRDQIVRARNLAASLLRDLEEQARAIELADDPERKYASLPERIQALRGAVDVLGRVIQLERQAHNLDDKGLPVQPTGPLDGLNPEELEAFDAAITAIRKAREPA